MQKIKLSSQTFDRVLKVDELQNLLDLESYIRESRKQQTMFLTQTKNQIKNYKREIYQQLSKDIIETNAKQLYDFELNLEKLLKQLNVRLFDIIYRILTKLGYPNIDSIQIKKLICEEIGEIIGQKVFKIFANQNLIEELKRDFAEMADQNITWSIDNSLEDEECICKTNLWELRIDIATLKKQINKILLLGEALDESTSN